MRHTLFISDLHLQEETPEITAIFLKFMETQATQAEALYILGDLFEAWVGDDQSPFNLQIIQALKKLVGRGMPVYFVPGNRDFLIGERFAAKSGVTLLQDPTVIALYGRQILVSHGDSLCTLDLKHQAYRKKVYQPWVKKLFLLLPLWIRRKVAQSLRNKSRQYHLSLPTHIMDVTPEAVQSLLQQYQTPLLIHGHTHRPAIHPERIVLGAWHETGNALRFNENGYYELINF